MRELHFHHILGALEGSVLWICKSPLRLYHKRKNWYVNVSVLPEQEDCKVSGTFRITQFRCGRKGGQNMNKAETGVRVTHMATELSAEVTEECGQHLNPRSAEKKLERMLTDMQKNQRSIRMMYGKSIITFCAATWYEFTRAWSLDSERTENDHRRREI